MAKTIKHTLIRETPDRDPINNEVLMVKMEPGSKLLEIWPKGRHNRLKVSFKEIYRLAYQVAAHAAVAERAKRLTQRRARR
jgi:hypothetical protein